jgi:hypothetical protein
LTVGPDFPTLPILDFFSTALNVEIASLRGISAAVIGAEKAETKIAVNIVKNNLFRIVIPLPLLVRCSNLLVFRRLPLLILLLFFVRTNEERKACRDQ